MTQPFETGERCDVHIVDQAQVEQVLDMRTCIGLHRGAHPRQRGQVLSGSLSGRVSDADITIFKSLGQAVEDLIVADYVIEALTQ